MFIKEYFWFFFSLEFYLEVITTVQLHEMRSIQYYKYTNGEREKKIQYHYCGHPFNRLIKRTEKKYIKHIDHDVGVWVLN